MLKLHCQKGIENWSVTLIDQAEDLDSLRKKELHSHPENCLSFSKKSPQKIV